MRGVKKTARLMDDSVTIASCFAMTCFRETMTG
jgi:hypothetical protein